MKKVCFLLILLLVLSLAGCKESSQKEPDEQSQEGSSMVGYVMNREGERVLVVDPVAQDFSSTGGVKEFYNAIWFSKAPGEIKKGDKVEVWYDMVAESYPGQSEVKHIKAVEEKKPEGADLTPSKALNKALTSNGIHTLTTLHGINYDKEKDQWTVQLKDIWKEEGEILEFQIEDK